MPYTTCDVCGYDFRVGADMLECWQDDEDWKCLCALLDASRQKTLIA